MKILAHELKQYIIDNNKVQFILESIGCHGIKEYSRDYRCGLPNDTDITKVSIYKDTLKTNIYGKDIKGDIFTLLMEIENISFVKANKKIHEILDLKYSLKKRETNKEDPLDIFKKARSRNTVSVDDIEIYDENILMDFLPYLHIDWVRQGIMPYTRDRFNIGFSMKHQRIIIPHRYWCGEENEYLGIMGRTINPHYEMLDIPKYYPIRKFSKGINLYGLQENYKYIQEAGYVVVAESEKSVLRRDTLFDRTVVALCGNTITEEQRKILIGLDVEIILALDEGIELDKIKNECSKFKNIRKVSYIYDDLNILKSKESPMDKCNKAYQYLLKNRVNFR